MKICDRFMIAAIDEARKNIKRMDGGPFGACIVKAGRVMAVGRNTVLRDDATCHAEVNAIRKVSKKLRTYDLSGCIIYSTTEPCPMCFSAIHWAKIGVIIYGAGIDDAKNIGFNELTISNKNLKRLGKAKIKIIGSFMRSKCKRLMEEWARCENKKLY